MLVSHILSRKRRLCLEYTILYLYFLIINSFYEFKQQITFGISNMHSLLLRVNHNTAGTFHIKVFTLSESLWHLLVYSHESMTNGKFCKFPNYVATWLIIMIETSITYIPHVFFCASHNACLSSSSTVTSNIFRRIVHNSIPPCSVEL